MPLLIDAYNVLHTVGILPPELAGIEVHGLIELLQTSRYRNEKATIVCDGSPQPDRAVKPSHDAPRPGSVTVRYSGAGRKADDLIVQLIRASTAPRRLLVISSDHEIIKAARRRRCPSLTSQEFLQHLADDVRAIRKSQPQDSAKPAGSAMSAGQVDRWVNLFKLDAETLAIESGASSHVHGDECEELSQAGPAPMSEQTEIPVPHEIPPGPVLPSKLIAEAEALWNRHQRERTSNQPPLPGNDSAELSDDESSAG